MGFESMRSGHARCPTYLVAGLLLMAFLLICNWWSLSTQNYELLKQMDDMGNQLNFCSDERIICQSKRNSLDGQLKEMQTRMLALESNNKDEMSKLTKQKNEIEKSSHSVKQDLTYCQAELDSLKKVDSSKQTTLESLRVEKDSLASQLAKAKEKIAELEETILKKNTIENHDKKQQNLPSQLPAKPLSTVSQLKHKDAEDVLPYPINDGPINDVNHEINKDNETALDNAANEDMDDNLEPDTGKRPPLQN